MEKVLALCSIVVVVLYILFNLIKYEYLQYKNRTIVNKNSKGMDKFNYNEKINPLAQSLCEEDIGNSQANFGQMKEVIKRLAQLVAKDETVLDTIKEYSKTFK